MTKQFVVDFDGTLIEDSWPHMGEWMPGAVMGLRELLKLGTVVVDSCRVNPYEYGQDGRVLRPAAVTQGAINDVRSLLDSEGLHEVRIHTTLGKPPGDEYIDNKGRRYQGHTKSWEKLIDILVGLHGCES